MTLFFPGSASHIHLDPNTVIRGGAGIYAYNWSNDTYNGASAGPIMGGAFGSKGGANDTTNGITPLVILSGTGSNLPYISATTDPAGYNGSNVQYAQFHQPVGGSYQWNVQVQQQLNNNLVASLAYVGSHGHDLPFPVDINQVPVSKLAPIDQQFRPYPQFGTIAVAGAAPNENAISNYNSLQATIQQRLSHGLSYNFSYVWSHFLDDLDSSGWGSHAGNTQNWQNAYIPSANYGNSSFDVRNAFKGYFLYQLPFGRGRQFLNNNSFVDAIIGGWQVSDTLVIQSGQPFTPIMHTDTSYSLASSNFALYPNLIGNPKLPGRNVHEWFNETAFAAPARGNLRQ